MMPPALLAGKSASVVSVRPAMRLMSLLLAIALGAAGCQAPVGAAPAVRIDAAPAAHAALPVPAPPPEPEPPPKPPEPPAASPPSFVLRTASSHYDFRLDMSEPCPQAEREHACAGPATLFVLTKSGAEVQKIPLEAVQVTLDGSGAPLVNAAELYDNQGALIVGDFDFDGREDFAVNVDHSGPYGGPTFAVFLQGKGERFVRSAPLSRLTQETLGFFEVDAAKKRLRTTAKSGCCYHVVEEHVVVGGAPHVVERVTRDATGDGFVLVTEERLVAGRWKKTRRRTPSPP
jgi:hypothetical protein